MSAMKLGTQSTYDGPVQRTVLCEGWHDGRPSCQAETAAHRWRKASGRFSIVFQLCNGCNEKHKALMDTADAR